MSCSLLLTTIVRTASLAMQPRQTQLIWRCHVKQGRMVHGYKLQKQRSYPIISSNVWFVPVLLMVWLLGMSCITLLALRLNINYKMDKGLCHILYLQPNQHKPGPPESSEVSKSTIILCSSSYLVNIYTIHEEY